ncbi:MAG: hypothetical protein ACI9EZ_000702 [Halobacteriales archaeon]|jgi:hypothetical protein
MVGPTVPETKQSGQIRVLKTLFVLLVALSGGLVALQGDASLPMVGASTVGAMVGGMILVWHISSNLPS